MALGGGGSHLDPRPPSSPPSLASVFTRGVRSHVLGPLRRAVSRNEQTPPALARLVSSSPPPSCLPASTTPMPPPPPPGDGGDPVITAIAGARDARAALLADGGAGAAAQFDALARVARAASSGAASSTSATATAAARHPANRRKNRYMDVLPYDQSRFVLDDSEGSGGGGHAPALSPTTTPPTLSPPHSGYINASLITCRSGETPAWSYIAAQGPLPHTIPDFWRMAAQARCPALVQLTGWAEGGVAKCAPYLPPGAAGEDVVELEEETGHVRASWEGGAVAVVAGPPVEVAPGVLRRDVVVTVRSSTTTTTITHALAHLHVGSWPDHGVLPPATLRSVAAALRAEVKAAGDSGGPGAPPPSPPLVHCSAGIGRTGTLLAVDIAARRLELAATGGGGDAATAAAAATRAAALARIVARLRAGRGGMVQTPGQYAAAVGAVVEEADDWILRLRREGKGG